MHGLCLYPIVNHPGWEDDRHCHNGLWDYPDEAGVRPMYEPLARELEAQRQRTESAGPEEPTGSIEDDTHVLDVSSEDFRQSV